MARRSRGHSLSAGAAALRGAPGGGREGDGLVVAVFGALSAEEARSVAAARRGTGTCVAVLVGGAPAGAAPAEDAAGGAGRRPAAGVLRAAGWRVLAVRSAADLARAWTTAGKAGEDFVEDGS